MPTEEEEHYLETLYAELTNVLGEAVWSFARIEWLTYELIGRLSAERMDELLGDISFRSRVAILRRLLARRPSTTEIAKDAVRLLGEAEALAAKRNIFVHNPWTIWIDLDAQEFMTEVQNYSHKSRKLKLDELRAFVTSARELERKMRSTFSAFVNVE